MENRKILGIDLGTNSLGWSVLEKVDGKLQLSKDNQKIHSGVIVFPQVTAGTQQTKSKAAERRQFRGARRMKFRRKIRKYQTLKVLIENKLCPLSIQELEQWKGSKNEFKEYPTNPVFLHWLRTGKRKEIPNKENEYRNPYFLRDLVSKKQINFDNQTERYQLGRALYHIAQRRGFKSNRLDTTNINLIQELKEELIDLLEVEQFFLEEQLLDYIKDIIKDRSGYIITPRKGDMEDETGKRLWSIFNDIKKQLKSKEKAIENVQEAKKQAILILNKKEKLKKVEGSINELNQKIESSGFDTIGQYFWFLYNNERNHDDNKIRGRYTSREEHYLREFDVIMHRQYPESINRQYGLKKPKMRYTGVSRKLYDAIFFQRPLKPQAGKVGKGVFETNKKRIPVSHYLFEEFRMWQFINSIKVKFPGQEERFLTMEEKNKIKPLFYRQKDKFKFDDIAKKIIEGKYSAYKHFSDIYTSEFVVFNYHEKHYVKGNLISAKLKKILDVKWNEIYKNPEKGHPVTYNEIAWHALYRFDDTERLIAFAKDKLGMNEVTANKFSRIKLPQGYASLSYKAVRNILNFLREGYIYSHAVFLAKLPEILKDTWKNNKEEIINGLEKIINNHRDELKVEAVINNFISKNRNKDPRDRTVYSSQAESEIKKEIEELFINEYGKDKWETKINRGQLEQRTMSELKKLLADNPLKGGNFYSGKTLEQKIEDFLTGKNGVGMVYCKNSEKLDQMYHPSQISRFSPIKGKNKKGKEIFLLPEVQTFAVNNPVLKRAMAQLRKLINYLLIEGVIDQKTEIHLEMARQVMSMNAKKAIEEYQKQQEDKKKEDKEFLEEFIQNNENCRNCDKIQITDHLLLKYRLWQEQKELCIYSSDDTNKIGLYELIKPDSPYDIEHTIPRSRSWDNSLENKTIAKAEINRKIKKNKIPSEMNNWVGILARIKHWKKKYETLDKEIADIKVFDGLDEKIRQKRIQTRMIKTMERDYWKGKYERFKYKNIPDTFKRRQLTDTGHITKMASEFLGSVFKNKKGNPNILNINGQAVATFRQLWGFNKTRDSHTHHMVDAIIAATISRNLFVNFETLWKKLDDKGIRYESLKDKAKYKPWSTFTEDVLKLTEETLVVQNYIDQTEKQTKKKIKVTVKTPPSTGKYKKIIKSDGSVIYNGIVYQQGDTARGPLHQQNFYRKVSRYNTKTGKTETFYVIRKELDKLKKTDVKNIYEENIRQIIEKAIDEKKITFNKSGIKINEPLWQNEEKRIPLKKIRIKVDDQPIPIKKYSTAFKPVDIDNTHFLAMNEENYGMILYENKKGKRAYKLINLYKYYNQKSINIYEENIYVKKQNYSLIRHHNKPLLIKKGLGVILMNEDEVPIQDKQWIYERLYFIKGIDDDGIKMIHHAYGGKTSNALTFMNNIIDENNYKKIIDLLSQNNFSLDINIERKEFEKNKKNWFSNKSKLLKETGLIKKVISPSKLSSPKGGDVIGNFKEFPYIKKKVNGFYALVENYDFRILPDGQIIIFD